MTAMQPAGKKSATPTKLTAQEAFDKWQQLDELDPSHRDELNEQILNNPESTLVAKLTVEVQLIDNLRRVVGGGDGESKPNSADIINRVTDYVTALNSLGESIYEKGSDSNPPLEARLQSALTGCFVCIAEQQTDIDAKVKSYKNASMEAESAVEIVEKNRDQFSPKKIRHYAAAPIGIYTSLIEAFAETHKEVPLELTTDYDEAYRRYSRLTSETNSQ